MLRQRRIERRSRASIWQPSISRRSKGKDRSVAGRMHESRLHKGKPADFLKQAKGILSAEQFAQLKAQCQKSAKETKKTEA